LLNFSVQIGDGADLINENPEENPVDDEEHSSSPLAVTSATVSSSLLAAIST